jgi:alkylation response protein AidB-like acyl-CoA dehydrogenase
VAVCAELVGTCERALALAVDYAKVRVQFDRPIATFQVIKHKAADMLHKLELARVATHYAAWASDAEADDRERAAAMSKGFVAEAANLVTAECIQIHGGVGFTWEVDCHVLYRRAKQDDLLFGAQAYQRERLADLILGPVSH